MPQKQRLRVWNGELQKTTGGLRKKDLVKNKRGKIVSRRKSAGAGGANNLGKWLRKRGDTFGDKPVALQKEQKKEEKKEQKKVKTPKPVYYKPKPQPPKQAPKPKPKPQPKPKPPKRVRAEPMKAGGKKDLSKISVGNILGAGPSEEDIKGWPKWAKDLAKKSEPTFEKIKELYELFEDWEDVKEMMDAEGGSLHRLKNKVKRRLKATKRRGKRRSKRALLRDVLDL